MGEFNIPIPPEDMNEFLGKNIQFDLLSLDLILFIYLMLFFNEKNIFAFEVSCKFLHNWKEIVKKNIDIS